MRVLLAETHALIREGLRRVALEIDATCEFVEAGDAMAARTVLLGPGKLDAVLFDAGFFAADELAALRRDQPRLLLLALIAGDDSDATAQMLAAGVNALVPKSAPGGILSAALLLAIAGDVSVRGTSAAHATRHHRDWTLPGSRCGTGPLNLTSRQYDVLDLVAQGRQNKAIATQLGIGVRTVKGHVAVILRALHADNRADAGRAARRWRARATALASTGIKRKD